VSLPRQILGNPNNAAGSHNCAPGWPICRGFAAAFDHFKKARSMIIGKPRRNRCDKTSVNLSQEAKGIQSWR
jgi:hypothetical protein